MLNTSFSQYSARVQKAMTYSASSAERSSKQARQHQQGIVVLVACWTPTALVLLMCKQEKDPGKRQALR